jgi:HD-GYP domain-containing protein (c-di-GMP phosphodiesterase class II)
MDRQTAHTVEKRTSDKPASIEAYLGRGSILSIMTRANGIAAVANPTDFVHGMIDLMMEITQADSANFYTLDPSTDEFVLTHIRGCPEIQYLIGLRLNRQRGLPGMVFCDPKIMVVGDLSLESDWLHAVDPANVSHKRNVINLPITIGDRILGVVQIYNYQHADIDLLSVLGERLAFEMERRSEENKTRSSNRRLFTLVDMLGRIAGTLDRNRLLHQVTENASRLVGAERSSVFLVEPNTREMIFQIAYQLPEQDLETADAADLEQAEDSSSSKGLYQPSPDSIAPDGHRQPKEFSFFNRSAITVPLRCDASLIDNFDDRKHVLGGLMVLNKQNAAFQEEDALLMRILANQASTSLQVAEMYESAGELFLGVIKALATAIDAKDPYTQGHSQRVSDYSVLIGQQLGLDESSLHDLRIGSLFHDIGKIGIADAILLKNGKLNDREYEIIKLHPQLGVNILSQVKLLEPMISAISEHHERLDGSGYPAKLTDKQISMMGRIVAVADVFDAMTSNRPYRNAVSNQEVLAFLQENAGKLFDAACISALGQVLSNHQRMGTVSAGSNSGA